MCILVTFPESDSEEASNLSAKCRSPHYSSDSYASRSSQLVNRNRSPRPPKYNFNLGMYEKFSIHYTSFNCYVPGVTKRIKSKPATSFSNFNNFIYKNKDLNNLL